MEVAPSEVVEAAQTVEEIKEEAIVATTSTAVETTAASVAAAPVVTLPR